MNKLELLLDIYKEKLMGFKFAEEIKHLSFMVAYP
jgi:hypothetical protein